MEVVRIPISFLVKTFIVYLVIHIGIAVGYKFMVKKYEAEPNNDDLKTAVKLLDLAVKWFAAVFVIYLIFMFYNM